MVLKITFLGNNDGAGVALHEKLLESCNLHTVLDCRGGTFPGGGRQQERMSWAASPAPPSAC